MYRTKLVAAAGAALLVCLPAAALASWNNAMGLSKPGPAMDYTPGAPISVDLFKRTKADDLHGFKTVVVPFFQVQFMVGSRAVSSRASASVVQTYVLEGLSQTQMQAMTDALYDRFLADLAAQGLTVTPLAEAVAKSPSLAKVMAEGKPGPLTMKTNDGATSLFFTPHGAPVYFHQNDPEIGPMVAISSRANWNQPEAARELNAALIGARVSISFVEQSSNNRAPLGLRGSTARVKSHVDLTIDPTTTHLWVVTPKFKPSIVGQPVEPVRYLLTSPLILPDNPIAAINDTTTAASKRGDAAADAVSLLLGGSGFNAKTKAYAVVIEPNVYKLQVGQAFGAVEASFIQTLKRDF